MHKSPAQAVASPELRTKEMSIPDAVVFAIDLQKQMRIGEAAAIYRAILNSEPDHPDALMYLGLLAHTAGEREAGEALVRRSIEIAPGYVSAHINLGNLLRDQSRRDDAEASYRQALDLDPDNADALCNLGSIHNQRAEFSRALELFRRAIELQPEHTGALHNMGNACRGLGRFDEAIDAYEQAGQLGGGMAVDQRRAGHALIGVGRFEQAAAFFERARMLEPDDPEALRGMARAHALAQHKELAIEAYREWLRLKPGDPVASHMLNALVARTPPARASDAYVRKTFDDFADSFDAVLDNLEYRAPKLVGEAVLKAVGERAALDVLDAGCGTGLVGVEVRRVARRLVGVDLSRGMLLKARERNVYDVLDEGELVQYVGREPDAWDLITCADTLCYFGDLSVFAETASRALRAGGRLVFTVEHFEDAESFQIEAHGRYSHARGYIEQVFAGAGFTVATCEPVVLRQELGQPVHGLLALMVRPDPGIAPAAPNA